MEYIFLRETNMTVNRIIILIALVIAMGLFSGCEKEDKAEKELPAVQQMEVENTASTPSPEKIELDTGAPEQEGTADAETEESVTSETRPLISATYIGAKKCKPCHIKQFKAWEKTSMATSFNNLKPLVKEAEKQRIGLDPGKDYTEDADCLKCHTTGYGKPGGFIGADETPEMVNVQCEECHGPGSEFIKIMKKDKKHKLADVKAAGLTIPSENEEGCMQCHGDESPFNATVDAKYGFDFKERLEKTHTHYPLKYEH